jgi:hypothetical protein
VEEDNSGCLLTCESAASIAQQMLRTSYRRTEYPFDVQEPLQEDDRKLALLAALLLPLRAKLGPPATASKKQKAAAGSAARHIVRCKQALAATSLLPPQQAVRHASGQATVYLCFCRRESLALQGVAQVASKELSRQGRHGA